MDFLNINDIGTPDELRISHLKISDHSEPYSPVQQEILEAEESLEQMDIDESFEPMDIDEDTVQDFDTAVLVGSGNDQKPQAFSGEDSDSSLSKMLDVMAKAKMIFAPTEFGAETAAKLLLHKIESIEESVRRLNCASEAEHLSKPIGSGEYKGEQDSGQKMGNEEHQEDKLQESHSKSEEHHDTEVITKPHNAVQKSADNPNVTYNFTNHFHFYDPDSKSTVLPSLWKSGGTKQESKPLPYVLSSYFQVGVNLATTCVLIYVGSMIYHTIAQDIRAKLREKATETMYEIALCAKNYALNKCDPDKIVPALEKKCFEWEQCMKKNPKTHSYISIIGAETLGSIVNSLFEPIGVKTSLTMLLAFTVWIFGSNFAFGYIRAKAIIDGKEQETRLQLVDKKHD